MLPRKFFHLSGFKTLTKKANPFEKQNQDFNNNVLKKFSCKYISHYFFVRTWRSSWCQVPDVAGVSSGRRHELRRQHRRQEPLRDRRVRDQRQTQQVSGCGHREYI